MRIIGGEFRSRRLLTPRDASTTRPIPDRVKESLFSLLRGHTEGASVFDAFAGTGAIGLEALSRGAARCTFVERDREIAAILRANIGALGVGDRCELVVGDALGPGALARCPRPVNLVFMDPPYPLVRDALGWKRVKVQMERLVPLLTPDGFAVLRTPWPHLIDEAPEDGAPVLPRPARRADVRRRGSRRPSGAELGDDRTSRHRRRDHEGAGADADSAEGFEEAGAEGGTVLRVPADLSIPGAEGPETHIYHSMALHLYARARSA